MSGPNAPEPATEPPLRLRVDGVTLASCIDALLMSPAMSPAVSPAVEVMVVRSVGQGGDYAWLGFVTYDPAYGWERNGLAAQAPGLGAGRRLVVDLRELDAAVRARIWSTPERACTFEWHADSLVIGDRVLRANGATIPAVPDVPTVRDAVYIGGSATGDVTVESEQGRICIPAPLVAHLVQRGAAVAELGLVAGDVYVVAQSERRGEASTDPVIIAPVDLLMWSPESSQAAFRERRRQGGGEVEQLLAALDPATPVSTLLELLDTGVAYVRRRAAAHPALPPAVTDALVFSGTRPMRAAVALNPSLSDAAIDALVQDPDAAVRAALGTNPAVGSATVARLACDHDASVRAVAARHPAVAPEVRAHLAGDPAAAVRSAVAGDPATPAEIVERLAADRDPTVGAAAAGNPSCPPGALEMLAGQMPFPVLANPAVPTQLLVDGSRAVDGALRAVVAGNPSTPSRVLAALSRDPDARVLRAVAANPRSPGPARRRAEKRMTTDADAFPVSEAATATT